MFQDAPVIGVASLGDDIFVVGWLRKKIVVYDTKTFTVKRHITIPVLGPSLPIHTCMAVCPSNNCVYASDFDRRNVLRVDLSGKELKAMTKWSVKVRPTGLSVKSVSNLLVVGSSSREAMLQIFSRPTLGGLIQKIHLHADIRKPEYAVQLPTGNFVVSYDDPLEYGEYHVSGVCNSV